MTGKELKELRIKANVTQQALANALGVAQTTVWSWESETANPHRRNSEKAEQFLKSVIAQNKRADSLTETLKAHQAENNHQTTETEYQKGYKDGVQAEIKAISDKYKLNI